MEDVINRVDNFLEELCIVRKEVLDLCLKVVVYRVFVILNKVFIVGIL